MPGPDTIDTGLSASLGSMEGGAGGRPSSARAEPAASEAAPKPTRIANLFMKLAAENRWKVGGILRAIFSVRQLGVGWLFAEICPTGGGRQSVATSISDVHAAAT